jgi:hypothetical protein
MGQFILGLFAGIVVGLVMEWVIDWTGLLPRPSSTKSKTQKQSTAVASSGMRDIEEGLPTEAVTPSSPEMNGE